MPTKTSKPDDCHLKCKCGAFEATLTGQPKIVFNCQCHSCVAAIANIEAKDGFNGTSMKCDDSENSGVAVGIYKSNNITISKVDGTKINFVKVGKDGELARPYCTDCGTVLFNVFAPTWAAANRNALTTGEDGTTPYEFKGKIMNVNCKHAFDKDKCPAPTHSSVPFGTLFKLIPLIAGIGCDGSNAKDTALVPEDMSKVEVVPITWEK